MLKNIPYRDDHVERYLYSHDISAPPLISRFFKKADGIFQPECDEDVAEILKLSKTSKKPVIPRGSATSGYGGTIPVKGGYVVDFSRMDGFEIDEEKKLLIAEPGAVWWDVEEKLNRKGLTLRVYPTSAPSSTVGGWIAQNGYGVGSLKYGSIAENVERLRVADFEGIKETGSIEFYAGLEGTTGIITKAWVKVKDLEDLRYYAFHVDAGRAAKLAHSGDHYSALFLSREYVKMKNQVFDDQIPEKDTLVIATTESMNGDEALGEEIWETRFYPMRIKRLGPGIIPAEVLIPGNRLGEYLSKISGFGAGSEVWFLNNGMCSVLSFLPYDERKTGYALKWRFSIKALKIAKKLGGKSYSSGLYLSKESPMLYAPFDELRRYKKKIDPENLLNPLKVFPEGFMPFIMALAEVFS
ncbi:FAD-binding protein [Geoglobus acetivorans]|uniref:FAD-binding oxidoreductase n=1 Tax=Geoglobus acetivorans TaxID=565033 RepID=A0ABZ3H356_GEOAI|nr:FAD-binding oxidoreductase [Geoglobus acetivorans]